MALKTFENNFGLYLVFMPFWTNLPHSNIFTCITLDILYQLHQGIIKDHLKKWCMAIVGKKTLDDQFQAILPYPGLWYWKNDISYIKQYHALNDFHVIKDLHSLVHYIKSIQLSDSLDGFNIENSEWLHIDYIKKAYAATNQRDYIIQITG
ncbi:hypothetical protein HD554DRAFT_2203967 [Boletus coccyginus]|nr:hypothetical protein HD554DRAFT_2203967 [Boletus coccyginus]